MIDQLSGGTIRVRPGGRIREGQMYAHRLVADQIVLGDHDLGKLLDSLLQLMDRKSHETPGAATYTHAELQGVIQDSKVDQAEHDRFSDSEAGPKE
jgi:hypothetical protein